MEIEFELRLMFVFLNNYADSAEEYSLELNYESWNKEKCFGIYY
jgi:hypothetical protein